MLDIIGTLAFILLGLLLAFESFRKWRTSGRTLYLGAVAVSLLAALAFFFDWGPAFWILALGMLLRVLGAFLGRKPAPG